MATMVSLPFSRADQCRQPLHAVGAEAGGRLVQAQHARALPQRDRDFQRAAVAIGQILGANVGLVGEADGDENFGRLLGKAVIGGGRVAHVEAAGAKAGQADHDVFARA